MNRFYKKKSFKVLLVVLGALLLLLAHTAYNGSFLLSNLFGAITTPMQKVSATVANGVSSALDRASTSYDDLVEENQQLRQQVTELTNQLSDYYQYKQENEQLKNFLELKTTNPDFKFAYGSVVSRDSSDLFYSFRVDKGSLDGVKVNDPVVTEEGLVGWVSSASAMYCNVTTILSPNCNISALDKVSRDSGVVTSDAALADQGLVRLSYLENDHNVKEGDMIVTSGIGGIFPKNLLIGEAKEVKSSDTDVSLYVTIEPYVDIKNVKDVVIITDFAGRGEALPETTDTPQSSTNGENRTASSNTSTTDTNTSSTGEDSGS